MGSLAPVNLGPWASSRLHNLLRTSLPLRCHLTTRRSLEVGCNPRQVRTIFQRGGVAPWSRSACEMSGLGTLIPNAPRAEDLVIWRMQLGCLHQSLESHRPVHRKDASSMLPLPYASYASSGLKSVSLCSWCAGHPRCMSLQSGSVKECKINSEAVAILTGHFLEPTHGWPTFAALSSLAGPGFRDFLLTGFSVSIQGQPRHATPKPRDIGGRSLSITDLVNKAEDCLATFKRRLEIGCFNVQASRLQAWLSVYREGSAACSSVGVELSQTQVKEDVWSSAERRWRFQERQASTAHSSTKLVGATQSHQLRPEMCRSASKRRLLRRQVHTISFKSSFAAAEPSSCHALVK